jgi:hypothetical protein
MYLYIQEINEAEIISIYSRSGAQPQDQETVYTQNLSSVSQYSIAVNTTSTIHFVSNNWHSRKGVRFVTDFHVIVKGRSMDLDI